MLYLEKRIVCFSRTNIVDILPFAVCSVGHIPGTDFGPVISVQAKKRICDLIQSGIDEGAKCVLDGRGLQVPGFEKGNFIGPTILTDVTVSWCEHVLRSILFDTPLKRAVYFCLVFGTAKVYELYSFL
jgi:acyl-CoA reductase-like NAD-dependent aldehyde dehydrogenase